MKPLTEMTQEEARELLQERKNNMQSVEIQDMADIFYNHRNETLTTEDFESAFEATREVVKKRILYLQRNHGLHIVNVSTNGKAAKYKLIGFKQPQKKAKQVVNKVKQALPKPSTFNPLIAQVFA